MTTANLHAPLGAVSILHIVDGILKLKTTLAEWNESRVTRKELNKLSARQLEDIGLTVEDIAKL